MNATPTITPSVRPPHWLENLVHEPGVGAKQVQATEGTTLYHPEDPARTVHLILAGQLRLLQVSEDGSERLMEILGPGQWCGVAALAGQASYGKRIIAVTDVSMWEIPAERLLKFLSSRPDQAMALVRELAGRLCETRDEAGRLVFDDCHQRLIDTLLRFSRTAAAMPHGESVTLHITHQQLAQAVGVARETVSLALTKLRRQNLVQTGRNQLTFNLEMLKKARECGKL